MHASPNYTFVQPQRTIRLNKSPTEAGLVQFTSIQRKNAIRAAPMAGFVIRRDRSVAYGRQKKAM
jgi:hypothetical protein